MKSLELTLAVARECGRQLDIDTTRDLKTISKRTVKEGDSFVTITLPAYGKALEACLRLGYVDASLFRGFTTRGGLPVFLQGFLRLIFPCKLNGVWYTDPRSDVRSGQAVKALRQICHLFGKVSRQAAPRRVAKTKTQFLKTDKDLSYALDVEVYKTFQALYGSALNKVEEDLLRGSLYFKHGPGAVAEKVSSNQKWELTQWTMDLQEILPWWHAIRATSEIVAGYRDGMDCEPKLLQTKPHSRLVDVPKTAKGPRLIAIEPIPHQFVQQMLFEVIERHVSQTPIWGLINWRDQQRNQKLAAEGSEYGYFATLDLSEASDRVHWGLVQDLLDRHQFLLRHVKACRSERIDVDGVLHPLKKFASMGSALTFPIETMIFAVIALVGTYGSCHEVLKALRNDAAECSAYGDDIIVPTRKMSDVVTLLESHGFKVNVEKSFGSGSFRESCGGDYYRGMNVAPVRARLWIDDRANSDWLEKTCNLRNRLFEAGYYDTASVLDGWLGEMPNLPLGTPALGKWTFDLSTVKYRWNTALYRLEARCLIILREKPLDTLDGYAALRKCLIPNRRKRPMEEGHLSNAGRPRAGRAKYGWTAVD